MSDKTKADLKRHGLMILLSVIYVAFMVYRGDIAYMNYRGDTPFHLTRIFGLAGVFTSPVNFDVFKQVGVNINQFYQWITLYPAYLLLKVTGSIVVAYVCYMFFLTYATFVISYKYFMSLISNQTRAMLFAVLYTFAAYRTVDIYTRAALGEGIALTFMPLVFVGFYHVLVGDYRKWKYLVVGLTGMLYSHLLSVYMVGLVTLLVVISTFFWWQDKVSRMISLIKAGLLTLGLGSFAIVPMLEQMLFQKIYTPAPRPLEAYSIGKFLLTSFGNVLSYFTVGLMVIVFIGYLLLIRKSINRIDKGLMLVSIITLLVTGINILPWSAIQASWGGFIIEPVQFLWRFNGMVSLVVIFLTVKYIPQKNLKNIAIVCSVFAIALHLGSLALMYKVDLATALNDKNVASLVRNYTEYKDYRTAKSLKYEKQINNRITFLDNKQVDLKFTSSATKIVADVSSLELANSSGQLVLPILYYLGQNVQVDGQTIDSSVSSQGTTLINIPSGVKRLEISYRYTTLSKASAATSLGIALGLIGYTIRRRRDVIDNDPLDI